MLHNIVDMIVNFASSMGYAGIFIMMMLEASFIPFPSEVAMIPAGYLSSMGKMDFFTALLVGTLGVLVGASINYLIGYTLKSERLLILIKNFGKYFLINEKYYYAGENYFKKHGIITIFLARFIPAIRQIITLPAGIFRINFKLFLLFTALGAIIWNLVLMYIGYVAGQNQEIILRYSNIAIIFALLSIVIIGLIYYYTDKYFEKKYKNKQ